MMRDKFNSTDNNCAENVRISMDEREREKDNILRQMFGRSKKRENLFLIENYFYIFGTYSVVYH